MLIVSTDDTDSGVLLPNWPTVGSGGDVLIFNETAAAVTIYPHGSDLVDGGASVSLPAGDRVALYALFPAGWMSSSLGDPLA